MSWLERLKSNIESFERNYEDIELTLGNIETLIDVKEEVDHLELHRKGNEELEEFSEGFCMKCDFGGACKCSIAKSILGLRGYEDYDNHRNIEPPVEEAFELGVVDRSHYFAEEKS